jgi:hypothetical protein
MKSIVARTLVGVVFGTALATSALAGPDNLGQICYFGECGAAAPASQANAFARHGSWSAVAVDGGVMVMDRFNDGSAFAIVDPSNGKLGLAVSAPDWHLRKGRQMSLSIDVDGTVFAGEAVAADGTTVVVGDITKSLIEALAKGQKAVVTVAGERFEMHLADAAPTLADAARYERTSAD